MKKIIAVFLVILFCTQVFPVKQIGYILCSNQITEEPADCNDDGFNQKKFESHTKEFFSPNSRNSFSHNQFYWHLQQSLPHNHSLDIDTPPPNASAA